MQVLSPNACGTTRPRQRTQTCAECRGARVLELPRVYKYIPYCYIANAKTKRDWLTRGHVALDKCNVSLRETSKKLLPGYEYKKNQNGGVIRKCRN